MSTPNTMRIGPLIPNIVLKKRYLLFYFVILWFSFIPLFLELWVYWRVFWNYENQIHFYIFLPLLIIPMYVTLVFSAVFIAKILH